MSKPSETQLQDEKLDIFRFINSRDIRKHLEDLKYEFNTREAAWLVSQCSDATIHEKHEAWNWIINHMPDMEVNERINCKYRESLHDTLKKYMVMEDDLLRNFADTKDAVYTHEYYFDGRRAILTGYEKVYFSLESCVDGIRKTWDDYEEEKNKPGTCIAAIRHFRDKDYQIEVAYNSDCEIKAVDVRGKIPNEEYEELLYEFFDGFWFDFPTPFKEGDIVCKFDDDPDGPYAYDFCRGIIVLKSLLPWNLKEEGIPNKQKYIEGHCGDTSDMTVYGYFLREGGSIYNESTWNYMDLEYYRGPLTGIKRICKALSSFVKGEIEIELFTYAHRIFLLEKQREDYEHHNWFTKEGLELAGLLENEGEQTKDDTDRVQ